MVATTASAATSGRLLGEVLVTGPFRTEFGWKISSRRSRGRYWWVALVVARFLGS